MTGPAPDVAAELEIRNVLARLAQLADTGATDEYVSLLADEVVWDMPANDAIGLPATRLRGHDEIADGQRDRIAAGRQGPGSSTMHVVTTIAVQVDGDEGVAESHFLFLGTTTTSPTIVGAGRYRDAFRRTDSGWKLAHRTITFG